MTKRKMNKKKLMIPITIAVSIAIVVLIFLPYLLFPVSSLGKFIEVCIVCEETQDPIEGLKITVTSADGSWSETRTTDGKGCSGRFGTGMPDGTYTIAWYWNEAYRNEVTINCSKIIWHYDYSVPNPVIIKHFKYDLEGWDYPPIAGLNVTLVEDGIEKTWALTDATGTVTFDGKHVVVCKSYQLMYWWGGTQYYVPEPAIHFEMVDGELLVCLWEETNYLSPKSEEIHSA